MIRRRWSLILISQISLWANFLIEIVEKNGPFFERAPLFEILVFSTFEKSLKRRHASWLFRFENHEFEGSKLNFQLRRRWEKNGPKIWVRQRSSPIFCFVWRLNRNLRWFAVLILVAFGAALEQFIFPRIWGLIGGFLLLLPLFWSTCVLLWHVIFLAADFIFPPIWPQIGGFLALLLCQLFGTNCGVAALERKVWERKSVGSDLRLDAFLQVRVNKTNEVYCQAF